MESHNRKIQMAEIQMTIFPKLTNKMSCKLICRKMFIFAIYCVSYMIFDIYDRPHQTRHKVGIFKIELRVVCKRSMSEEQNKTNPMKIG